MTAPDLLQRLEALAARTPLYCCVDLASAPRALQTLGLQGGSAHFLIDEQALGEAESVAPMLVPLGRNRGRLARSIEHARGTHAWSWIASALPPEDLVERLRRRIDVTLPDGQAVILRCFDPRVLHELATVLTGSAHHAFFALGDQWLYLDRDDMPRAIALTVPAGADPVSGGLVNGGPLALDATLETALLKASVAGQAVLQALQHVPGEMGALRPGAQFELARRCAREMTALGVDSQPLLVALLIHCAASAGALLDSRAWHDGAAQVRSGTLGLDALLDQFAQAGRVDA